MYAIPSGILGTPKTALGAMHAQMEQRQRLKNFDRFKENDRAIIVATDVVGRGTDVPEVKYVIHYQFPRCAVGGDGWEGSTVQFFFKKKNFK